MIEAVVFDLDGVLIGSEQVWDEARRGLAADRDLAWPEEASRHVMGMTSPDGPRHVYAPAPNAHA